jgi:hypothetical protein
MIYLKILVTSPSHLYSVKDSTFTDKRKHQQDTTDGQNCENRGNKGSKVKDHACRNLD